MNRYGEMEAFVQVVEAGGFTEAARKLRLTPSAVSKLISRLEDRLGARLLHRTTRRVSLTAEGRAYFDELRGILAEIDAVEASIGGAEAEPRGLLRVNVAHGFGMSQIVPLVPDFVARYPQVQMQISFDDHIVDLVSAGEDVGIRLGLPGDDTLIARKLGDYRRMICGAVSYFERFGVPQTPVDLEHHRAVLSTNVALLNHWPMRFPMAAWSAWQCGALPRPIPAMRSIACCWMAWAWASPPISFATRISPPAASAPCWTITWSIHPGRSMPSIRRASIWPRRCAPSSTSWSSALRRNRHG